MAVAAIDAPGLKRMLVFVGDEIIRREAELNALDGAAGDGDHGITMRAGFEAIRDRLAQLEEAASIEVVLGESGGAFLAATGGAIGVILGKMLMAGGKALRGVSEIRASEFVVLLQAIETSVSVTGKVKPGDRTILDSIHAAAAAVSAYDGATRDLAAVAERAAVAAEEAARSTADMLCRVGRASRLGPRALGHPDAGATSFAIMLRASHEWIISA